MPFWLCKHSALPLLLSLCLCAIIFLTPCRTAVCQEKGSVLNLEKPHDTPPNKLKIKGCIYPRPLRYSAGTAAACRTREEMGFTRERTKSGQQINASLSSNEVSRQKRTCRGPRMALAGYRTRSRRNREILTSARRNDMRKQLRHKRLREADDIWAKISLR